MGLTKDSVTDNLEYFGMLRTGMDVTCGYKDYEELRLRRQAYILHCVDIVLQNRNLCHKNDLA